MMPGRLVRETDGVSEVVLISYDQVYENKVLRSVDEHGIHSMIITRTFA